MIFEVWFTLVAMATVAVVLSLASRNPAVYFVTGLLWFMVAWNCAEIEFIITYINSDYNKGFQYPYLVTFFSLVGLAFMILAVFGLFEHFRRESVDLVEGGGVDYER